MTTDPFTTADDRWDESPHHLADHCEHAGVGKACRRCRRKFDAASQWAREYLAAQEPTDAELDALYDTFIAHSEDERNEEYTRTEDGKPYHERICSECGEAVWIKGERYWAATRANGARKRHHAARTALSAARAVRRGEENR